MEMLCHATSQCSELNHGKQLSLGGELCWVLGSLLMWRKCPKLEKSCLI